MVAFYNEIDKYCCRWLEHLISGNELPFGIVNDKPIQKLYYSDLSEFDECHFFAGIGGWPKALQLANWPKEVRVWTGSCPCQPFSISSLDRKGEADDRHLWPTFHYLVEKHRPTVVFGEQVSGSDGYKWLSTVIDDFHSIDYDVASLDIAASIVGAEHERGQTFLGGQLPQRGTARI